jgi:hypothetical protein
MIRRLLLAAILPVAALIPVVTTTGTAYAQPGVCGVSYTCVYDYYSTAADTDLVGVVRITCGDVITLISGEVTEYAVTIYVSSCSPHTGPQP